MRLPFWSLVVIAAGTTPAAAQIEAPAPHRAWSAVTANAGFSIGESNVSSEGDQCFAALGTLGLGVRIHDLAGIEYQVSKMPCDGQRVEFRAFALNFYPAYRAGLPSLRVSLGFGSSKIRRYRYAGGHATDITQGNPSAASVTLALDHRWGYVSLAPYMNVSRTVGSGLSRQYCSTPGYFSGDFTSVCSTRESAALVVSTVGLSLGIR
jgi:hypothetical protein